ELGIPADWRLTGELEEAVGVQAGGADDGRPELALGAPLARASFVISSPSTLLVEAMLAGRMTGMLFPFDAPRWPQAPVVIDGDVLADRGALRAAIEELAAGGETLRARQSEILRDLHGSPEGSGRAPAD